MASNFDPAVASELALDTQLNQLFDPINDCEEGVVYWGGTTAGTAPDYTATVNNTPRMLAGQRVVVLFHATNDSTAVTLNLNSEGAEPVAYNGSTTVPTGTLPTDRPVELVFDGTNWNIMGLSSGSSGGSTSASLTQMFSSGAGVYVANMAYSPEADLAAVIGFDGTTRYVRYAEYRNDAWVLVGSGGRGVETVAQTPLQHTAVSSTNPSYIGYIPPTSAHGGAEGKFLISNSTNNSLRIVDIETMTTSDQAIGTSDNNNIYAIYYDEVDDELWMICGASQGRLIRVDPTAWGVTVIASTPTGMRAMARDGSDRLWVGGTGNMHYVTTTTNALTNTGSVTGVGAIRWIADISHLAIGGGSNAETSTLRLYDPATTSVVMTAPAASTVGGANTIGYDLVWDAGKKLIWTTNTDSSVLGYSPFGCQSTSQWLPTITVRPRSSLGLAYGTNFSLSYGIGLGWVPARRQLLFSCFYAFGLVVVGV